ncbi:Sesquiterpene synthase [Thalictrum thalictroides]|uniref:Sesquiterpene synthase n=1 Tax=Thalictrum thalictroides TaxID=46969 RepID=A0A7J6V480_THATH|nr:Sesquiterpene synthase [Thalictrum thalictroides]
MDEAMYFSTKHLNSMLTCLSSSLALQVQHALTMPLQRSPERVYARHYISIYQQDISRNETLLEFAKLDYNFVQLLHQKEINELQKWDANSTNELSDRMRVVFNEVLNLFNGIEEDMIKGGNVVGVSSFKNRIQVQTKDLLEEIKVILSGKMPTLEDWLSLSVPTAISGVFVILSSMYSRELATKEVFDWIATMPKIINYSDLLTRLIGDIASLKVEQDRGTYCNSVPCYMMDHGVSESEAIESLEKIISSIWKVMNEECLRVHPVPLGVIKNLLNYDRSVALYFAGADGHSVSDGRTKQIITSIFVNPIPI